MATINDLLAAEADRERMSKALEPFAEIGQWLFARDVSDDEAVIHAKGINGYGVNLTRGHFKAAFLALHPDRAP